MPVETNEERSQRFYVIRQDADIRRLLYGEIQSGRVRQGWGYPEMDLRLGREAFARNWPGEEWGDDKKAVDRYAILSPTIEVVEGDVVLVPRQPDWGSFALALAARSADSPKGSNSYSFDNRPEGERGTLGTEYRHVISVDPSSVRTFRFMSNLNTLTIEGKIMADGSAVNNVWNTEMRAAVRLVDTGNHTDRAVDPTG